MIKTNLHMIRTWKQKLISTLKLFTFDIRKSIKKYSPTGVFCGRRQIPIGFFFLRSGEDVGYSDCTQLCSRTKSHPPSFKSGRPSPGGFLMRQLPTARRGPRWHVESERASGWSVPHDMICNGPRSMSPRARSIWYPREWRSNVPDRKLSPCTLSP